MTRKESQLNVDKMARKKLDIPQTVSGDSPARPRRYPGAGAATFYPSASRCPAAPETALHSPPRSCRWISCTDGRDGMPSSYPPLVAARKRQKTPTNRMPAAGYFSRGVPALDLHDDDVSLGWWVVGSGVDDGAAVMDGWGRDPTGDWDWARGRRCKPRETADWTLTRQERFRLWLFLLDECPREIPACTTEEGEKQYLQKKVF